MLLIAIAVLIALVAGALLFQPGMQTFHNNIVNSFVNVEHIDADTLTTMDSADVVLFDVREQAEFAVSHIEGATRVDPNISPELFEQKFATLLSNKTAVFYCSVGQRSSELASRLDDVVEDNGGAGTYNLVGGIFQWRNESRQLRQGSRQTSLVHPYNRYWGRLTMINRRSVMILENNHCAEALNCNCYW